MNVIKRNGNIEELSYDNNIEITIIDDGDKIKVDYDSESEKWLVTYKNL